MRIYLVPRAKIEWSLGFELRGLHYSVRSGLPFYHIIPLSEVNSDLVAYPLGMKIACIIIHT